jgi:hypothetical protein
LNLVEKGKSRQVLRQFHLQELSKWGYKPGVLFYFEAKLDGQQLSTVEFGTRDGLDMANLLTDYVHAFMQEAELEKARGGNVPPPPASPSLGSSTETSKAARKYFPAPTAPATATASSPALMKSPSLPPPQPPPRPRPANTVSQQSVLKQYSSAVHHRSATKIQSLFRGFSLRNEWIKEDAVILIQAVYRGFAERCRVALMLEELFQSGQLEFLED